MKTIKLYREDVDLRQCDSTLLAAVYDRGEMTELGAKKQENTFLVVLDRTVFFPEGGGQPCDTGFVGDYPVFYVFEKDGVVYHQVSAPSTDIAALMRNAGLDDPETVRRPVHCQIDWNRRFLHMQMHCGEHILSGMFYQEFGGVNRGFHMGDDYMTIDINLEERPEFTEFTQEMIDRAELLANKAVWSNVPVTVLHFDRREDAAAMPLRKALAIEEDITIVCVGSPENPADCVACCGTHPKTAGQVGLIKIIKAEAYKGMTRFTVKAGQTAFADFVLKHRIVSALGAQYSADPTQLMEKIKVQENKNGAVRKELYDLKKTLISRQADVIEQIYSPGGALERGRAGAGSAGAGSAGTDSIGTSAGSCSSEDSDGSVRILACGRSVPVVTMRYDYFSIDDLQTLGRRTADAVSGLLILVAERENTALLVSGGQPDCGKLVRENAEIYQGKGGGNATLARAIFSRAENLDTYLDLIEKHLR